MVIVVSATTREFTATAAITQQGTNYQHGSLEHIRARVTVPHHADGSAELDDDPAADAGGLLTRPRRQLVDDRLQRDAADVAQLLLLRDHVVTERVDDRLHLQLLHFDHQRTQTDG